MYKCPHCFHPFQKHEALFRCGSIAQVCSHEEDIAYNTSHESPLSLQGHIIQKTLSKLEHFLRRDKESIPCEICARLTRQRVCPHCHHNLSDVFFKADFVALGFIAERPQDLDTYVTYLRKGLEKVVADDIGYGLKPELSATKWDIYLERAGQKGQRPTTLHVRFYPLHPDALPKNVYSFDGLILFCDKDHATEGRPYVPNSIQALTMAMEKKIKMPVALVYSCFETLAMTLPSTHPLFRSSVSRKQEGERISSDMLAYTGYWFGANVLQLLKRYFLRYRLFCQSFTYPEEHPFLANSGWHIEDPFVWILECLGKIKREKNA